MSGAVTTRFGERQKLPRKEMGDLDLSGKRLLIREDLNVPMSDGVITNDARIRAALPSLRAALEADAAVIVMSHLGRPVEGQPDPALSLAPVAIRLGELLGCEVELIADFRADFQVAPGALVMLENVRFLPGEKADDSDLARQLGQLADIFVMDAFATAHRAQASTHGVAKFAAEACAGPLLVSELNALEQALSEPSRPLVAIVGGAKVSSKLEVLGSLADMADRVIVGGGIANTFIAAAGYNVGQSLYEPDLVREAQRIASRVDVPLPVDVMVAKRFDGAEVAVLRAIDEVSDDEMILDIGPETARQFSASLVDAGTILWNGPVGVFEFDQFGEGTRVLGEAIATAEAFSIAGGGDTLAALDKYGLRQGVSYISTGGGAFLEFVEGKSLPAVEVLAQRAAD
jgi:phosphoglycerate kinase